MDTSDRQFKTFDDFQTYKRSKRLPDVIDLKRDNAMQLYVPHDLTSVVHKMLRGEWASDFYRRSSQIVKLCI